MERKRKKKKKLYLLQRPQEKQKPVQCLCPQPSVVPETALPYSPVQSQLCRCLPLHSPPISSRALPSARQILVSMPVSLFPHLAVSWTSFMLSTQHDDWYLESTVQKNLPQRLVAPYSSYPKENTGPDWQRHTSKATESVVEAEPLVFWIPFLFTVRNKSFSNSYIVYQFLASSSLHLCPGRNKMS